MKIVQAYKNNKELWPRISLVLSIGFLALSVILLIVGNQLLGDSTDRVLEHRLVIAQMIANQLDRSLTTTINELNRTRDLADFDPSDPNLYAESQALTKLYNHTNLFISQAIFLDSLGHVVFAYPPTLYAPGTDLSDLPHIADAIKGREVYVSTPFQEPPSENLVMAITIPIYDGDRLLGWLSGVEDIDELAIKNLLEDAVALDHTAHGILVDSQGRSLISTFDLPFLSLGEHYTFYRQALSQGQPVVQEVLFELDLPDEPPGHHHIMAFVPLKTVPWGISIGGDVVGETFAESYRVFIWLAVFFMISVVAIWGTTMMSARKLLEPIRNINLKNDINQQISDAKDWEETTSLIVRIPATFLPVSGTRLMLSDDVSGDKVVAEWSSDGSSSAFPSSSQSDIACETCVLTKNSTARFPVLCAHRVETPQFGKMDSYCLPLVHQESLIGTLHFNLPSSESLSENRIDVLTSVAPNMAIAIHNAQLQRSNLDQIEITQAEQRRIFRRLHDTLGQNITFLRLKLDQYSMLDSPISLSGLQQEIEGMRKIAEEAHEQIRNILKGIHPETQTDLVAALRARGNAVAERAHFNFELTVEGQPKTISQDIKRHVLFICHEALNNIEKHANAKNATIRLLWGKDDLTFIIADDGSGFELGEVSPLEHFGLEIMQERTNAINGKLTITPLPNTGTEITLLIPLSDMPQS